MLGKFKLGTKFTALLLGVFLIGVCITGAALSKLLQQRAEMYVASRGSMLMQAMNSVRDYTNLEVTRLIEEHLLPEEFAPQVVPAYSARRVFEILHEDPEYSDLLYKEAVLNPTNPNDQADQFETDLTEQFRRESDMGKLSGFRDDLPGKGMVFYSALPIAVRDQSCLRCHGAPEEAPQAMVAKYGRDNGFNWELNTVVGAQVVYAPAEEVFQSARRAFSGIMSMFVGIFAIAILLINWLLKPTVLTPIQHLAKVSHRLGSGDIGLDETQESDAQQLAAVGKRGDELGQLARVFHSMVREVIAREQFLKEQVRNLRIEIDQTRREREVSEITDSDYFQNLQKKAKQLRNRPPNSETPDNPEG